MFYKWPQGRVVRTSCLIIAGIVCADLGYNGAWGKLSAAQGLEGSATALVVQGVLLAVLAFAAAVAAIVCVGVHRRCVDFLIEVEREMFQVEWPAWNMLWRSTLVIAVVIVVMAVVILGVDAVLFWGLDHLRYIGSHI